MLALATATYAVCFAAWTLPGALAPLFRGTLQLSATQTGWLVTAPVLVGALARLPVGWLADRFGARRVLSVLVAALIAPALLAGASGSYAVLLLWGGVLGLSGAAFPIGVQFVGRWFPTKGRGLALGVFGLGNAGAALSAWLAPPAAAALGTGSVLALYAAALALTAAAFFVLGRAPAGVRPASGTAVLRSLKAPKAWVLAFYYFIVFGGFLALSVHLPTVLVEAYRLSSQAAGSHVGVFALVATLARPLGGYAADRFGGVRVLYGVFPAVAALALLLAAQPAHFTGTAVIFALGMALGTGNGAVTKLVAEWFPEEMGAVSGLVGATGSLGGLLLPMA